MSLYKEYINRPGMFSLDNAEFNKFFTKVIYKKLKDKGVDSKTIREVRNSLNEFLYGDEVEYMNLTRYKRRTHEVVGKYKDVKEASEATGESEDDIISSLNGMTLGRYEWTYEHIIYPEQRYLNRTNNKR